MRVSAGGATGVKSLQGSEAVLGTGPLETRTALTSLCLDKLQLAVERMDLGRDIENASVGFMVAGDLCRQTPIVGAAGQIHGLVIGGGLAPDGVDEPHWKWLGGGVAYVGGGSVQVVLKDWVALLTKGAESEGDRAVAQFDVARLAHDVVGVGDDKVGESTVILLEPSRALCVGLTRHFRTEIRELLAKLLDLSLGLEVLESAADSRVGEANGDGAEGARVEFRVSLHDIEGALGRKGVVVSVDTVDDFALFCLGVWGDGESRAYGSVGGFGGWCARRSGDDRLGLGVGEVSGSGGRVHERNGGGAKLCSGRDDFDGVVEDVDGLRGGRHIVVGWRCCCR